MADVSKVRLVRCPKCTNLLPELPDYSVYKCGGCGTILRAKKRDTVSGVLSEKPYEEKGFGGSERLVDKGTQMEDNESESNQRKERVFVQRNSNFHGDLLNKEILVGEDSSVSEDFKVDESECGSVDSYSRFSGPEPDHRTRRVNRYTQSKRPESVTPSREQISAQSNKFTGSVRSRPRMDWSGGEKGRFEKLHESNTERVPTFSHRDEGPSNYDPFPVRVNGVEKLEQERAELLRKLDELKEQLSRSYLVAEPPKEREPYQNQVMYNLEKQIPRPSYVEYSHGPVPFTNHHDIGSRNFYCPQKHSLNEIPEYDDPRARNHHHRPGKYTDFDLDHFAAYQHENFFHAPACSCLICYNQTRQVPPRGPPVNFGSNFYHHEDDRFMFEQQSYPPPQSLGPERRMRWASDIDPEIDGYGDPRRIVPNPRIARHCRPVGGGAPFIACHKCFELLKIPRKKIAPMNDDKLRLRCGACSALILLKIENDKLVTSGIVDDDGSYSEGFKPPGYNFGSDVTEPKLAVEENERSNLYEAEKRKGYSSSPSVSSKEEESVACVICPDDFSESSDFPLKSSSSPVPPRSPMWQESDSPNYGLRNESKHKDNDNVVNRREDSVRNDDEATELDVSFSEYQTTSQDFPEMSEHEYRLKLGKGGDSLVGFIKKSFRDLSKSSHGEETERPKVFINGQPLPDRAVKRAEKHAGPIRPGDYWYDFRAGFWGVMGQPCLGIIPPFIEEFNYPMPTNCCAGNTRIYINGRELNQRDLDLLASRGLPTTQDKFYIVEISGKLVDQGTGKELHSLGKLAPTVERTKKGFGMKVPKDVS